jgi:hypothetical protein
LRQRVAKRLPSTSSISQSQRAGSQKSEFLERSLGVRSRRLLMVIAQEPPQSLAALHGALAVNACIAREQHDIALSLMIALGMIVFDEFVQRPPQGTLSQKDHLGQALLLHRPDPAS